MLKITAVKIVGLNVLIAFGAYGIGGVCAQTPQTPSVGQAAPIQGQDEFEKTFGQDGRRVYAVEDKILSGEPYTAQELASARATMNKLMSPEGMALLKRRAESQNPGEDPRRKALESLEIDLTLSMVKKHYAKEKLILNHPIAARLAEQRIQGSTEINTVSRMMWSGQVVDAPYFGAIRAWVSRSVSDEELGRVRMRLAQKNLSGPNLDKEVAAYKILLPTLVNMMFDRGGD